ncbi:MAG: class I SAM-dependent methyltransferase [Acidobacteria bacterium]|nr:class I SAM-dependent methyltransferase [Acidobacteriota bacterium]
MLDIGCGPGRLAIGLMRRGLELKAYRGLDVNLRSIRWCQRYITRVRPEFRFVKVDVLNSRYNPNGRALDSGISLPFPDGEFDIIYLYSVFSHMTEPEVRIYLGEMRRLLTPTGRIFLTGFVEEGVPQVVVNPDNYRQQWKGPLHCVRYERGFFEALLRQFGFILDHFEHGTETNGQSGMYVSKEA